MSAREANPWWANDHLADEGNSGWMSYAQCVAPTASELAETAGTGRTL